VGARVDWSYAHDWIAAGIFGPDGYADIWVVQPDGTGRTCLTCSHPVVPQKHNDLPAWHPTGEYILFQSQDPTLDLPHVDERLEAHLTQGGAGLNNNLWLITRDGRQAWQLTRVRAGEASLHAHISPDGRRVLWAARIQEGRRKVWALRLADLLLGPGSPRLGTVRTLRPHGGPDTFYESHGFSPDGRTILFSASIGREHPFDLDIWSMDLATGRLVNLTDTPGEWDEHAHFSPDGGRIVWMTNRGYPVPVEAFSDYGRTLRTDYWLMDADGTDQRRLTFFNEPTAPEYAGGRTIVADVAWNRDGTRLVATIIVFARSRPSHRIVLLDLAAHR
jgi:Tol biopolymer transport system component